MLVFLVESRDSWGHFASTFYWANVLGVAICMQDTRDSTAGSPASECLLHTAVLFSALLWLLAGHEAERGAAKADRGGGGKAAQPLMRVMWSCTTGTSLMCPSNMQCREAKYSTHCVTRPG